MFFHTNFDVKQFKSKLTNPDENPELNIGFTKRKNTDLDQLPTFSLKEIILGGLAIGETKLTPFITKVSLGLDLCFCKSSYGSKSGGLEPST